MPNLDLQASLRLSLILSQIVRWLPFLFARRGTDSRPMVQTAFLRTGEITFLFTDTEGATKLWESNPDAMRLALAPHDALLRKAIHENEGVVFKTVGDAFCTAFATASEALRAALSAKQQFYAEVWPQSLTLKVIVDA